MLSKNELHSNIVSHQYLNRVRIKTDINLVKDIFKTIHSNIVSYPTLNRLIYGIIEFININVRENE